MEKYLLLLFLSCCGAFTICGAQTVTVRGRVIDRKTGEVLSDANVADLVLGTGVATNSYGLYSIHVKSKQCILRCSMLGYATKIDTLTLAVNMVHDFALMPDNYQLNDVEIVGERKFGGQLALTQKEIQSFPTLGAPLICDGVVLATVFTVDHVVAPNGLRLLLLGIFGAAGHGTHLRLNLGSGWPGLRPGIRVLVSILA